MTTASNISTGSPPSPEITLCLCDNDWIIKIAVFALIKDALKVLGVQQAHVKVLGTCRAVTCSSGKVEKYGRSMVQEVEALLKQAAVLADAEIDTELFSRAFTPNKITDGEAQLFSAHIDGKYLVATDDKRAMVELARRPDLADIHQRNAGRVVCMEQIVVAVVDQKGFDYVDKKIRPVCWADDKILQAWAGGKGQESKETMKVMRGHIDELRQATNGLLYPL